ncbi:MAG: AMP-binding protein [Acidobacteriota bacterium]|nr:AMP-binding protein [Acidobacteriota bacterium]
MYPGTYANTHPDKPAVIQAATGEVLTYGALDEGSMRIAQLFRTRGIGPEDSIAIFLENHPRFFEVCWAAQRSALRYTAVSSRLTAPEVEYVVRDCGAKALVTSLANADVAAELSASLSDLELFMLSGETGGFQHLDPMAAAMPAEPPSNESEGVTMLYSSGTTGRPKGIRRPMSRYPMGTKPDLFDLFLERYEIDGDAVYLSPAPLYHSAPLHFNLNMQRIGATCVVMERFDAEDALRLIEKHRVTHAQWVPSMFVRMLKLPQDRRQRYDVSSMRFAIHAAAPCPVPVKQQMIEWWGPTLHEYYAGTEGNGSTGIDSHEWLSHPGSVGKPRNCKVHIIDDDGNELPPGKPGGIYFSGGGEFEYHNDPEKTEASYTDRGWSTLGDIGYLDDEGYLYLTDRRAHMIIRGGVNIYPQEAENVLITHPSVYDVAVIGVPSQDFGEEVKGVVQPMPDVEGDDDLERELLAFCVDNLAKFKCPASIDFEGELPRHPTGKLYKRLIKDRYWGQHDTRIV